MPTAPVVNEDGVVPVCRLNALVRLLVASNPTMDATLVMVNWCDNRSAATDTR